MAHQWAFLTHSIVFSCGVGSLLFVCLFFPGVGVGVGCHGGTALYILSDTTEKHKKVMGCVVLCTECRLDISSLVLQYVLKLCMRSGSPVTWAGDRPNFICFVHFLLLSFFPFLWRHHMLVLCLYECFNHFHGGRILYLCSCTILFFSARKSVMYEINQSHLFENKPLFWTL